MRELLRLCVRQRASISDPHDPAVRWIGVIIAITGACFKQDKELAGMWAD
jgi:hypothetical protein